jgi:hypothetical protein
MQTVIPDFTWQPSTRERYNDQLNVLFPAEWIGQAFLVGEPYDHDHAGRPAKRPRLTCAASRSRGAEDSTTRSSLTEKGLSISLGLAAATEGRATLEGLAATRPRDLFKSHP